jgi:serine/threonine-protein kinase PpkA
MGRCEITVREFRQFVEETDYRTEAEAGKGCYTLNAKGDGVEQQKDKFWRKPGFSQTDNDPVVCVSFNDVQAFIAWLNLRSGVTYRLPTEAEWEYAARAGTQFRFSFGDDLEARTQCDFGNGADQTWAGETIAKNWTLAKCNDRYKFTAPVGSFRPNAFGLYDMHGNAWEWNQDCWHDSYASAPQDGSAWLAKNEGDCERAVVRGGSWDNYPLDLRSAHRLRFNADDSGNDLGFRVARTL